MNEIKHDVTADDGSMFLNEFVSQPGDTPTIQAELFIYQPGKGGHAFKIVRGEDEHWFVYDNTQESYTFYTVAGALHIFKHAIIGFEIRLRADE